MITLIEGKYAAEGDQWGWKLHTYHLSEKEKMVDVVSYHGTFEQLAKKVLGLELGAFNGELQDALEHLSSCVETIVKTMKEGKAC